MENQSNLNKIPSHIRYYLLGWKDFNMEEYMRMYGDKKIRDLSMEQLHELFSYATTKDGAFLAGLSS